ncbi:hypothetical protein ACWECW_09395, partial [Rhodococcus ruber]
WPVFRMAGVPDGRCSGWPVFRMAGVPDGRCSGSRTGLSLEHDPDTPLRVRPCHLGISPISGVNTATFREQGRDMAQWSP